MQKNYPTGFVPPIGGRTNFLFGPSSFPDLLVLIPPFTISAFVVIADGGISVVPMVDILINYVTTGQGAISVIATALIGFTMIASGGISVVPVSNILFVLGVIGDVLLIVSATALLIIGYTAIGDGGFSASAATTYVDFSLLFTTGSTSAFGAIMGPGFIQLSIVTSDYTYFISETFITGTWFPYHPWSGFYLEGEADSSYTVAL